MLPFRISVIIPCYRDSATLKEAIESIYAQTREVQEVIVINDNSPESQEIEAVIQGFPNVRYYKNKSNLGLAGARNVGIRLATGDVVSFLDADDQFHPKMIEIQLIFFNTSVAVSCKTKRFVTGEKCFTSNESGVDHITIKEVSSPRSILFRNNLTGSSLMIARDLLLKLGGYDDSLRSCEDYDLWLRILAAGIDVNEVQQQLYFYRKNENGLSQNLVNISFWEMVVLRKYFQREHNIFLCDMMDAIVWSVWLLKHLARYEKCKKIELHQEIKKNIALLDRYPVLRTILNTIDKFRVMRIFV